MATKSRKLKLKWWQELVYYCLIAIAPIVITCIELFQSHSTIFQWSFASIGAILITYIVIRKFVLEAKIKQIKAEIHDVEHDYSLAIGDDNLAKNKWKKLNLIVYAYNAVMVLLWMLLIALFVQALADGLIAFKGASLLIFLFVLVGMMWKILIYLGSIFSDKTNEGGETTDETNN